MSKKSASMAHRLFAAMPHSPVPSVNGPVRTHLCVRSEQSSPTGRAVAPRPPLVPAPAAMKGGN